MNLAVPSLRRSVAGSVEAWRGVNELVPVPRLRLLTLAALGAAVGLTETMFLAIIATAGVALAGGGVAAVKLPFGVIDKLSIPTLLIAGTALAISTLAAQFLIQVNIARINSRTTSTLRQDTYRAFVETGWAVQRGEIEGVFVNYMTGHIPRVANLLTSIIIELTAAITLLVFIVGAVAISPFIAVVVIALGALLFSIFLPVRGLARRAGRESAKANRTLSTSFIDAVAASREIKAYGVEDAVRLRIDDEIEAVQRPAYRSLLLQGLVPVLYQRAVYLILLGGLGLVYALDIKEVGSIGAALLLVLRAMQQGQFIQVSEQAIAESRPWIAELKQQREYYEANIVRSGSTPLDRVEEIEFDGVSYRYGNGALALDGVSFTARRGDLIGLVGPSGSGKSTLSELIVRLDRPTAGRYKVNGRDSWDFDQRTWTEQVVLVPQLGQLIEASIEENIRFLRPGISHAAVVEAAVRAHLLGEIDEMEAGFDTFVGERGRRGLSGGQRQRLSIARAVARRPSLVVLDEPTSSLDHEAEDAIVETIEELRTHACVFVIAHRLSTLRHCDRVLVLRDGKQEMVSTLDDLPERSEFLTMARAASEL